MNLSPEQKKTVSEWITGGASISDVQKRLREIFDLSLTYMDTRFLIDDLGLDIKAPKPPPAKVPDLGGTKTSAAGIGAAGASARPGASATPDADAELIDEGDAYAAGQEEFAEEVADVTPPPGAVGGKVTIEVDRLTRPGTVVSGSVKFSDGNSGKWALDQYGRLIFEAATPGYRPSQADLQAFQRELSSQLQRHGY